MIHSRVPNILHGRSSAISRGLRETTEYASLLVPVHGIISKAFSTLTVTLKQIRVYVQNMPAKALRL